MITVLIVEDQLDHQIYLNTIVNSNSELKCLGIVRTGNEAMREILIKRPNVVLMDIGLPDISGIECILKLKGMVPRTRFLICTVYEEDECVFDALKAGAHGYIVKKSKPYQILDAIKDLYNGESPISSCIAGKILNMIATVEDKTPEQLEYKLTSKEEYILRLLAKGYSNKEVADLSFTSIKTIKWHVYNIYRKLHADNRTDALNRYFGKPG